MKQSNLEAMRIISQWENSFPVKEESETCFSCFGTARYEVLGRCFCDDCAREEFADYSVDEAECDNCGLTVDTVYRIGNDTICRDCFEEYYRM